MGCPGCSASAVTSNAAGVSRPENSGRCSSTKNRKSLLGSSGWSQPNALCCCGFTLASSARPRPTSKLRARCWTDNPTTERCPFFPEHLAVRPGFPASVFLAGRRVGRLEAELTRDPSRQVSILVFQRVVIAIGKKGGKLRRGRESEGGSDCPGLIATCHSPGRFALPGLVRSHYPRIFFALASQRAMVFL